MIKINNLSKKFKDVCAVKDLSLEIKDNQVFALLGLNGAGKTTTINILCSLIKKDRGEVLVNSFSLDENANEIKKIINVSPQETAIANNLTVEENLDFMASLYGVENKKKKIEEMLGVFDLIEKRKKIAKTLSGGQKRRLSIAMAMITNPKILILDEPTLGLDIKSRKKLWGIIEKCKQNKIVILTTHYLEEAEHLADTIAIMNKGELVICGTCEEIIKSTKEKNFEDAFLKLVGEVENE